MSRSDRVLHIRTGGTVVECREDAANPQLAERITAGLNDKTLLAKRASGATPAVSEHWVLKTSKARKPVKLVDPANHASDDAEPTPEPSDAVKCRHMQSLYVEADYVAVLMSVLGNELFDNIRLPEAVLHIEPTQAFQPEEVEAKDAQARTNPVADPYLSLNADSKVPPCSRILTRMMEGYSEPFPKKQLIVQTLRDESTGEKVNSTAPWLAIEKKTDLPTRDALDLSVAENKMLGEIFAFSTIMGFLDAFNNIDLSNSGFVTTADGTKTAIVDLGLSLGWGFGGQTADSGLFSSTALVNAMEATAMAGESLPSSASSPLSVADSIHSPQEAGGGAASGFREESAVSGYQAIIPFDSRVLFALPRMIIQDLFSLKDPTLRDAFIATIEGAAEKIAANPDLIQTLINASLTHTTEESALKGADLKKVLNESFYFPPERTADGDKKESEFVDYTLANILKDRIADALNLVNEIKTAIVIATEKGLDDAGIGDRVMAVVEAHNTAVITEFLNSQRRYIPAEKTVTADDDAQTASSSRTAKYDDEDASIASPKEKKQPVDRPISKEVVAALVGYGGAGLFAPPRTATALAVVEEQQGKHVHHNLEEDEKVSPMQRP